MTHEDADAGEAGQQSCQLGTGLAIEVIGRLIHCEHIGSLPERAGDLQFLALTETELVPAPGHVIGETQAFAEAAGLAAKVEREVHQDRGRFVCLLWAVGGEQTARNRSRVGFQKAAGDFGERGLAAAVVAQKPGPTLRESNGHVIQNRVLRCGVRVGHTRECELHKDIPSLFDRRPTESLRWMSKSAWSPCLFAVVPSHGARIHRAGEGEYSTAEADGPSPCRRVWDGWVPDARQASAVRLADV
ncbi:Uncharacterised protein [Collinsella intestinalis]|nr:Uncharacterised protein [Collinsella intestinalis]